MWYGITGEFSGQNYSRTLNKIILVLACHTAGSHTLRMAGYADFLDVVCQAFKIDADPLLDIIAGQQKSSSLEHSIIWQMLEPWLRETDRNDPQKLKNNGEWVSTSRLHTELKRIAERTGDERTYTRAVVSARALSHQLKEIVPDMSKLVEVDFEKKHPANEYRFSLREKEAA